jgi:hypothetical protein
VALPRAESAEEVIERMRRAAPATADELEWLAELDAQRAAGADIDS